MTPISETAKLTDLAERAAAYGMPGVTVDGNDPEAVRMAVRAAAARARGGSGPTLIEAKTVRLMAHYNRDIEHYRTSEDKERGKQRDPLPRLRAQLLETGFPESELETLENEAVAELDSIVEQVIAMPKPDPADRAETMWSRTPSPAPSSSAPLGHRGNDVLAGGQLRTTCRAVCAAGAPRLRGRRRIRRRHLRLHAWLAKRVRR